MIDPFDCQLLQIEQDADQRADLVLLRREALAVGVDYERPCYRCSRLMTFIGATTVQAAWKCGNGHVHLSALPVAKAVR